MRQPTGLALLWWLAVAVTAHVLVALFGVLNRWLQIDPAPPVPAMRLAALISLIALATVTTVDMSTRAVTWVLAARARRRSLLQQKPGGGSRRGSSGDEGRPAEAQKAAAAACCRISADAAAAAAALAACDGAADEQATKPAAAAAVAAAGAGAAAAAAAACDGDGAPAAACDIAAAGAPRQPRLLAARSSGLAQQQLASFVRRDSLCDGAAADGLPAVPPPRPELALRRGLSRRVRDMSKGRPRLVRWGALALITSSFASAYACQITAPGFVDPSLVQLINMFTVLFVALVQSILLRHRLPWVIWPTSAMMLGGACLVIVPSVGESAAGGIHDWRGWLGFGLSICSMLSTVVYFVSLQASRRLGFTSIQLQYLYLLLSVVVLTPLTLALDGTDWSAQFRGWNATDWALLVLTGSAVCVVANLCIQHSTWQLGAPTVSMFYGLRLVAAIVESKLILGTTIIKSGLQIAGTVVTICAVTVYLMFQWRASKAQQREEAAGAHEAAKGDEELPVGSLREHAGAHGADVASAAEQGAAGPHPDGNRTEAA